MTSLVQRPIALRRIVKSHPGIAMNMPVNPFPTGNTTPSPVTVWYDSACPLCSREIALMQRLDWRDQIAFVDLHDPAADCPLDPALLLARFHAQDASGTLHSGAAAFALMWRQLPLLWPLGQLARLPVILNLLERAYCRFLPFRARWLAKTSSQNRLA